MPWFRIDDSFCDHPKVLAAGNAATGLFVRCLSYCAHHLTDGFVPAHVAQLLGTKREIEALRKPSGRYGPLWVAEDGGYRIPDYLEYNPSRAEVLADRAARHEAKVEAGRIGGIASGIARRKHNGSRDEAETKQSASGLLEADGKQNEAPSHPSKNDLQLVDDSPPHPQPVDISSIIRKAP